MDRVYDYKSLLLLKSKYENTILNEKINLVIARI